MRGRRKRETTSPTLVDIPADEKKPWHRRNKHPIPDVDPDDLRRVYRLGEILDKPFAEHNARVLSIQMMRLRLGEARSPNPPDKIVSGDRIDAVLVWLDGVKGTPEFPCLTSGLAFVEQFFLIEEQAIPEGKREKYAPTHRFGLAFPPELEKPFASAIKSSEPRVYAFFDLLRLKISQNGIHSGLFEKLQIMLGCPQNVLESWARHCHYRAWHRPEPPGTFEANSLWSLKAWAVKALIEPHIERITGGAMNYTRFLELVSV